MGPSNYFSITRHYSNNQQNQQHGSGGNPLKNSVTHNISQGSHQLYVPKHTINTHKMIDPENLTNEKSSSLMGSNNPSIFEKTDKIGKVEKREYVNANSIDLQRNSLQEITPNTPNQNFGKNYHRRHFSEYSRSSIKKIQNVQKKNNRIEILETDGVIDATEYHSASEGRISLLDEDQAITLNYVSNRPSSYIRVIKPHLNEEYILKGRSRGTEEKAIRMSRDSQTYYQEKQRASTGYKYNFDKKNQESMIRRNLDYGKAEVETPYIRDFSYDQNNVKKKLFEVPQSGLKANYSNVDEDMDTIDQQMFDRLRMEKGNNDEEDFTQSKQH